MPAYNRNEPGNLSEQAWSLILLSTVFFLNFTSRVVLGPLLPIVEKDLGLSHGEAGSLFLMISAGYFITMIASGFVSARLGHRRCVILSAFIGGLSMILAGVGHTAWPLFAANFFLGLSAGLYLPSGIATVTGLVRTEHWGRALAVHETAPNLGLVLAPFMAEAFVSWLSWRVGLVLLGIAGLLAGGSYLLFGPRHLGRGQAPNPESVGRIIRNGAFWHLLVVFGLAVGGSMGLYSMMPLFLVTDHGLERGWANTLVALSRVPGLFTAYVGGWLADRTGVKWGMVVIMALSGLLIIIQSLVGAAALSVLIFVQTALAASFFPVGFAALAHLGRPEERSLIVSLSVAQSYLLGAGVIPAAIGFMSQAWSFTISIAVVGISVAVGAFSLLFFNVPSGRPARP